MEFIIGNRPVGERYPTFIIAEIGQAHDGSLGMCYAYVDAVAKAGADAVKFQTHIARAESTLDEPFRVKFSYQDETRFDYWQRMEFTHDQWEALAAYTASKGLVFLSSPFSTEAIELLDQLGVFVWKVGSGEVLSNSLLDKMMATGKPVLLSTGMSDWNEIDLAVNKFTSGLIDYALFQCTTQYPNVLEDVGLNVISEMRERYGCVVGLSDHSGSRYPSYASISRNVDILELHVTFHKDMFGPDVSSSLTIEDLTDVCSFRNALSVMDGDPVDKNKLSKRFGEIKTKFAKSVALVRDLPKGYVLNSENLTVKKPGGGIPEADLEKLIGRVLSEDVKSNRLLRMEQLDD